MKRFARDGYARLTAVRYLSLLGSFNRYAEAVGCSTPEHIDRILMKRFLAEIPTSGGMHSQAKTALSHLLRYLAWRYPQAVHPENSTDTHAPLLSAFDTHLRDVRGLREGYRQEILRLTRRMLVWYREHHAGQTLSQLSGEAVLAFVSYVSGQCVADATRSAVVSYVRTFLRYLRWEGIVGEDLARLVPRVPCWRMARVPDYLPWNDVRRVIDGIDTSNSVGKRDRAIVLLLATTGLRSQEVRRLQLQDVYWRTSEVHVRMTKSGREHRVPLLEEAGSALADYVLHGRPQISDSTIFLCHRPPVRPLRVSGTLTAIVRRRLAHCGIHPARAGAHLLRHSLATRMVQEDCPVKGVADLLGHRSIDTTAIYVKVALPQLLEVALPFPGDGS